MRGATQCQAGQDRRARISIHAPHARSDGHRRRTEVHRRIISIHAPHARSDWIRLKRLSAVSKFQSTLLMRGATRRCYRRWRQGRNFNPRSSCEERLVAYAVNYDNYILFQSTLLMRGATRRHVIGMPYCAFQSTLLMRGATHNIHASIVPIRDFNPRSSCEERPAILPVLRDPFQFQSTLLMRGATTSMI